MTFTAYIQRQKQIIKTRRERTNFLSQGNKAANMSESERLLAELSSFKGLNTQERMFYMQKQ